ncbi:MAG: tetratricopeptide repeat protein [Elusimicrobia bacterium]|nr:tetratricopeptide repeat protein [Elusimicrobiota bacterium]
MKSKFKRYSRNIFLTALFVSPLIFFTNVTRNPYLIQERVYQVLVSLALIFFYLQAKEKNKLYLPSTFLDKPLLLFLAVTVLSVAVSLVRFNDYSGAITGYAGRRMLMFILCGIITFYITAGISSDRDYFKKIIYALVGAATVASFYAIMQFMKMDFIWPQSVDPYGQRSISTFGNPNFLSSFLLIAIFWIIGKIYTSSQKIKNSSLRWYFLLVINLAGLAITMTRSTYAGLAAGIGIVAYYLIRKSSKKVKKPLIIFVILMISIGGLFSSVSEQFRKRAVSFFSIEKMGSALTQRMMIWESSYNMFKETPVIGRGWGNFEIFYPIYQGQIVEKEGYKNLRTHANNSHNIVLELLTQVGILGTGIYIFLVLVFVKYAFALYSTAKDEDKIWVVIFSVAGRSFWIDNILNVSMFFPMPAIAFWVNAGLFAGLGRKYSSKKYLTVNLKRFYKFGFVILLAAVSGVIYFNGKYFFSAVHFFKGFKYSRQGRLEPARKELKKAHSIYSLNVDNNYELGNVYARLNGSEENSKKAVWAYKEALRANPGYDEIYFNLGILYLRTGRTEKAKEYLKRTVEINPLASGAVRTLGDIAGSENNLEEALRYYSKAYSLNPTDEKLITNYGYYYQQTGDLQKAASFYVKALKYNSSYKPALNNLRNITGKVSGNLSGNLSGKNLEPGIRQETETLFKEIAAYIQKGNWPGALRKVDKILTLDPSNLKAMLYAGNIHYKLGSPQKAKQYYKIILGIDPDNKTARTNMQVIEQKP